MLRSSLPEASVSKCLLHCLMIRYKNSLASSEARHFKLRQKSTALLLMLYFIKSYLFFICDVTLVNHWNLQKNLYLSYFCKCQKLYTIEYIVFTENLVFYMCLSVRCSVPVCNCIGLRVIQRGNDRSETLYKKFHQFLFCKWINVTANLLAI